jgi:pimeloyl-ACP methyl ester carboxylesterase
VAEDIAALIQYFGRDRAILAGHDFGGALAQDVALRFPSLVESLILLNTPPLSTFDSVVNNDSEQQATSAYTLAYLRYQPGDDKNVAFVTRNIRDSKWRATIESYSEINPIEGMIAYYKANYPAPLYRPQKPAGHIFTLPTVIIWGTEEEHFAAGVLDGLAKYYSASLRLVAVTGAGHWVHQDAPSRVNREIRSWLALLPTIESAEREAN